MTKCCKVGDYLLESFLEVCVLILQTSLWPLGGRATNSAWKKAVGPCTLEEKTGRAVPMCGQVRGAGR
jgi:hypothetical protein